MKSAKGVGVQNLYITDTLITLCKIQVLDIGSSKPSGMMAQSLQRHFFWYIGSDSTKSNCVINMPIGLAS